MITDLILPITFYGFAGITLLAAIGAVSLKSPIHSVLCLILAFFGAAGLFVLLGAELVAMILVVVYVGAVAVLFLFVVMMLDVETSILDKNHFSLNSCRNWLFVGVAGIALAELIMISLKYQVSPMAIHLRTAPEQLNHGEANSVSLGS